MKGREQHIQTVVNARAHVMLHFLGGKVFLNRFAKKKCNEIVANARAHMMLYMMKG